MTFDERGVVRRVGPTRIALHSEHYGERFWAVRSSSVTWGGAAWSHISLTWCARFRVQGAGFRVQGAGFRVQGAGCRVQGAGFRVQGTGFRVQDSGSHPTPPPETRFRSFRSPSVWWGGAAASHISLI